MAIPVEEQQRDDFENRFSLYANLGGYTALYGLGIEYMINRNIGLNVGFTYFEIEWSLFGDSETVGFTFVPVFLTYYVGSGSSKFFMDLGADYIYISEGNPEEGETVFDNDGVFGIAGIGYAYHPGKKGFFFKIGPNLLFTTKEVGYFAGLSIGGTF
jgi:hypothetical protein